MEKCSHGMEYRSYLKRGSAGKRVIPKSTYYRWRRIAQRCRRQQPDNNVPAMPTKDTMSIQDDPSVHGSSLQLEPDLTFAPASTPGRIDSNIHQSHPSHIQQKVKQKPIYATARINPMESRILILSYAVRHGLSNTAIDDLLDLINFHLPDGCNIATSTYLLEKEFGEKYSEIQKHWYCPGCETEVEDSTNLVCPKCAVRINAAENYFIFLNVKEILKNLLEYQTVTSCLLKNLEKRKQEKDGIIRDIMDGAMYQNLNLENYDLSCCVNSDGVKIFKKSKYSVWPILLSINELDYALRRKHTVLAGLWFGYSKPKFEMFINQFVRHAQGLCNDEFEWKVGSERYLSKMYFPMLAADSGARYELQGINSYTGEHSCSWCTVRGGLCVLVDGNWIWRDTLGKNVEKCWRQRKWVFDPKEPSQERTRPSFIQHLTELRDKLVTHPKTKNMFGIKVASPLLTIPGLNIVGGFLFDYMHTVLVGVLRTFTLAFLDSTNHKERFYIGTTGKTVLINQRIAQCKMPSDCSRTLRGLGQINFWKANEWKQWFILCLPILAGILPEPYLSHFAKFIHAFSLLLQNAITEEDIIQAEKYIKEFQDGVPVFYGLDFCLFNVHILKHAPQCVRNWGPLWAYSLFQFENFNGLLKKCFSGTRYVGLQMCKRVLRVQKVVALGELFMTNSIVRDFYFSLGSSRRYYAKARKLGSATFCGACKTYIFSEVEKQKLKIYGLNTNEGKCYEVCIVKSKLFTIAKRNSKLRCNSIAQVRDKFYIINEMIRIIGDPNGYLFCNRLLTTTDKHKIGYKVSQISNVLVIFRADEVESKKFICRIVEDQVVYISELINCVENE